MKQKLTLFAILIMALAIPQNVKAYDFSAVAPSGQTLYYNIISGGVEITYPGHGPSPSFGHEYIAYYLDYDTVYPTPTGDLIIPSSVSYGGHNYTVTSIGSCAFADCDSLSSVTIPNTITTLSGGAFVSCSGLRTVYFNASNCTISVGWDDCSDNYIYSPFIGCDSLSMSPL